MGIFSRITDIVNSNILHMIEKSEDPQKMVRLMIQEMEDTLVEVKSSAAKIIADQRQMERELEHIDEDSKNWQEKAELAISKGRDDLAKGALVEKNKLEERKNQVMKRKDFTDKSLKQFRDDIAALETKLEDAKDRQKQIINRKRTVHGQNQILDTLNQVKSNSAFDKFERFERDLDRLEGKTEAMRMGTQKASLQEELSKLQSDSKIEDELAALKERMKSPKDDSQE